MSGPKPQKTVSGEHKIVVKLRQKLDSITEHTLPEMDEAVAKLRERARVTTPPPPPNEDLP